MDIRLVKFCVIYVFQCVLFFVLFMIGLLCGTSYISSYSNRYKSYSFTYARLAEFKRTLANGCSNLTDLPCSLQMDINIYFFWTKFMLIYYSSIIIAMIYIWHRTVRLFSCFFALFVMTVIIFGTNRILLSEQIVYISSMVCGGLFSVFSSFAIYIPHILKDPLSVLCGYHVPLDDRYEFLQNGTSKHARFYQWVKKLKKQWNIEEEKLIITAIAGIITSIIIIILSVYVLTSY